MWFKPSIHKTFNSFFNLSRLYLSLSNSPVIFAVAKREASNCLLWSKESANWSLKTNSQVSTWLYGAAPWRNKNYFFSDFYFLSTHLSVSTILSQATIRLAMLNNYWAGLLDMLIYANTVALNRNVLNIQYVTEFLQLI